MFIYQQDLHQVCYYLEIMLIETESKQKFIKCHDYIKSLCEIQTELLKVIQGNLAKVLDKHISKRRSKFVIDFKTFHASDLALTTRRQ